MGESNSIHQLQLNWHPCIQADLIGSDPDGIADSQNSGHGRVPSEGHF